MKKYNVFVCGTVTDTDTDFSCNFRVTVNNGGSVGNVGKSIQLAIDNMKDKGHPLRKPEPSGRSEVEQ